MVNVNIKSIQVEFVDPDSKATQVKTINTLDCVTEAEYVDRLEAHQRSFIHRVKIGMIKPGETVVESNVVDVNAPQSLVAAESVKVDPVTVDSDPLEDALKSTPESINSVLPMEEFPLEFEP